MKTDQELIEKVLSCANKVAGTSLSLPPDGDLAIETFQFDSLSLFAFILELEETCGIKFDDVFINHERLRSIRSVAALVASCVVSSGPPGARGLQDGARNG
jgi:acyl carrier protein